MYKLGELKIYNYIKQLGLAKTKAKNTYYLSKIIHEKFNNIVPNSFQELESLPGVGHKTASVVMSQVFGVPSFPVDTHIHRLSQRWGLTSGKNVIQTEKDLKRLFPKIYGISYIYKLFFTEENIAQREDVTVQSVTCVRNFTLIGRNQLFV